jgi:hypothetical protein
MHRRTVLKTCIPFFKGLKNWFEVSRLRDAITFSPLEICPKSLKGKEISGVRKPSFRA